ncbi:MAG: dihydrofolate reductase [Bacteroidia bacterium]|jgi:dihydrofolate reductase|nr:dihydrofolate reductase [Bacteroidia bacterium]
MIVSIIVATSLNNAIGKNNQLLWHLPADLKFFKATTMGCPVIMGRKTFQSIGRTLPGRTNVVITRDKNFNSDNQFGIVVVSSIDEALVKLHAEKEVFIIGGGEIYNQTIDIANVIYRTLVNTTIDGDVYFSDINSDAFNLVWEEKHEADEKNKFDYTYQKFERIGLL